MELFVSGKIIKPKILENLTILPHATSYIMSVSIVIKDLVTIRITNACIFRLILETHEI